MAKKIDIGGELHSVATDHKVADASEIKDISKENKSQAAFNNDIDRHEVEIHGPGGIESRLTDVEQLEQIVLDGGEAQIAQGSDFTNPDATKRAKIPTVGAIVDGLNDGIYDVSKRNPTSGPNSDGKFTLDYILDNANTLIPIGWRHGGMTISFVQSSDNKYVQFRYMSTDVTAATFTNTDNWSFCGDDVLVGCPEYMKVYLDANKRIIKAIRNDGTEYFAVGIETQRLKVVDGIEAHGNIETDGSEISVIESPEYVRVFLDGKRRVLFGVQNNGNFYFGAGVPQQVIDYINEKIAELSLDEYEDIVAFLNGLEEGDKTLQDLLNEKVDKEEGKSLIDEEYASTKSIIDNPEFLDVTTDSEDKILEGIQKDGTKVIGGDLKVLGNMEVSGVLYKVIENPEYLAAWVDTEGKVIFGLKTDGKTYVGDADFLNDIKNNQEAINEIKSYLANFDTLDIDALSSITAVENPEFLEAKTDSEGKLLTGRTPDGAAFEKVGFSTPKVSIDGHIIEDIEDPESRREITIDSEDKIVSYRDKNGVLYENAGINTSIISANRINLPNDGINEFMQAIKNAGFNPGGVGDWSDYISNDGDNPLHIPEPRLALVNISGIASMPTAKGSNWPCVFEMWDNQGNYFKKNAIIDDQGNTTRMFPKHNFAIDLFDSEVDGDAFKLKVGDWVPQDSFHFKAQYTDFFRGISMIAYKIVQEVNNSRSPIYGNPWKKALLSDKTITSGSYNNDGFDDLDLQTDTGAKCIPDGFPCIVYLNGTFYGVFNWALKKSRDNYHQKKDNPLNIHLDGGRPPQMQPLDWTKFEVRNPSYLVYAVPVNGSYKYDADIAQAEIAGLNTGETALSWDIEDTYSIGDIVSLNNRLYLSKSNNNIGNNPSAASYGKKPKDVYSKSNAYWIEITYTNTVKQAVIGFNIACNEVNTLSGDTGKEYLSTHFDVDNLIDFYLCQLILADEDIWANYQWITYDGIKWWLTDYDKDRTFGQIYMCPGVRPASEILVFGNVLTTTWSPFKFLLENYVSEIKTRYTELRSIIFTEEHIIGKIKDWMARIGTDNLKREFERWPESPCNRDSKIDREHWEVFNANYSAGTADNYDNTAQYHVGDSCYYSAPGGERHTKFKCIKDSLGNPPITSSYNYIPKELGYYDSLWRVITFVHERIPIIDDYVNSLS